MKKRRKRAERKRHENGEAAAIGRRISKKEVSVHPVEQERALEQRRRRRRRRECGKE
jgi:hypothetical protein